MGDAVANAAINYNGPDESLECAYPDCTNRLRLSDYAEPQFCSREHRDAAAQVLDSSTAKPFLMTRAGTFTAESVERLVAERDYYRRRWIIHGIRWPVFVGWPTKALAALTRAQEEEL